MSNIIQFPKPYRAAPDPDEGWTNPILVRFAGEYYLQIAKMWGDERFVAPYLERVQTEGQLFVEWLGPDPDIAREKWNAAFPDNCFFEPEFPPCFRSEIQPVSRPRDRIVSERNWVTGASSELYRGPA